MRTILAVSKSLALRSGAESVLEPEWIIKAAAYLLPLDETAASRLEDASRKLLQSPPSWGGGDAAEAEALFTEAGQSTTRLSLPDPVRDFIARAGGIDAKLTRLVGRSSSSPATEDDTRPVTPPAVQRQRPRQAADEVLAAHLIGQDAARAAIKRLGYRLSTRQDKRPAPLAVLFLAGPPATGKTLTANLLAEALGEGWQTLLIDMARMQSDDISGAWLVGLRQPYAGAGPGQATEAVRKHSRTVLIFDNFHAPHPRAQEALLPVFDTGILRDDFTQTDVDFRETILVFTSNLGAEIYGRPDFLAMLRDDPSSAERAFLEAIANETTQRDGARLPIVSPELLSRLARSTLLLYAPLSLKQMLEIARKAVTEEITRIEQQSGCRVAQPGDDLLQAQLLALAPQVDARRASSALPRLLFDPLEDALIDSATPPAEARFVLDEAMQPVLTRWASDAGLDELRRKQRGMTLDSRTVGDGRTATITWHGGQIRKVARAVDFDGPGAIRIEIPDIAFSSIAGHDRIKARLREVAELLRQPDTLKNYGTYPSRGMLLHGRPGTGKTMMAKAFANHCDLPFIATTGSELLNVALLRRIFKRAREYAPAIVFIDEIDALGRRDLAGYTEPINELLAAIDGFDTQANAHLFVIAASNYPQRVDPALLRAGRIDMHVELPAPDRPARAFFVDQIISRIQGASDRERLLDITAGMTGAELERVKREAALLAMRDTGGLPAMTAAHVVEAVYQVKYGERYAHRPVKTDLEQVAYHEAGHAVCAVVLNPEQRIEQVSIIARGDAAGFVSYIQDDESVLITVREVREAIAIRLAGRGAEYIACNGEEGIEAGAESDLRSATAFCRRAIANWGMDEAFGLMHIDAIDESGDPSVCTLLNSRIRAWLEDGRKLAEEVLRQHWQQVEEVAQLLLKEETLDGGRVKQLVAAATRSSNTG